jgi:hypothetical protein
METGGDARAGRAWCRLVRAGQELRATGHAPWREASSCRSMLSNTAPTSRGTAFGQFHCGLREAQSRREGWWSGTPAHNAADGLWLATVVHSIKSYSEG